MKKSFVILFLLALSFVGSAQQETAVEYKRYNFCITVEPPMDKAKPDFVEWYHKMDLYIGGKYEKTLYIGNSIKVPVTQGFDVPLGSCWELVAVETYAMKGYYQINIGVMYWGMGCANIAGSECIDVYVSGIF